VVHILHLCIDPLRLPMKILRNVKSVSSCIFISPKVCVTLCNVVKTRYFSSGALYRSHTLREFAGIRSCIEFTAICVTSGAVQLLTF
jgi:hypothetical protein